MFPTNEKAPSGLPSEMELLSGRPLSRKEESTTESQSIQAESASIRHTQNTEEAELKERFAPRKEESGSLAKVYELIAEEKEPLKNQHKNGYFYAKARRTKECGSFLEFGHAIIDGGEIESRGRLYRANFCRDRLCPMCQRRRELKLFGQMSRIMDRIEPEYSFIFITLTIRNVPANRLTMALNRFSEASDRFLRYKRIERVNKGIFRALEITYNPQKDTYHPHMHMIMAVPKDYFSSSDYIQHEDWLKMWQRAYNDKRILFVNVKAITRAEYEEGLSAAESMKKAVREAAKYTVKASSFLFDDMELSKKVVFELSTALRHRRLIQFRGCFQKAMKELRLEDVESADCDLTHIESRFRPDVAYMICRYNWKCGAYVKTDEYILEQKERKN